MNLQAQIEILEQLALIDAELRELNDEYQREKEQLSVKRKKLSELGDRSSASRSGIQEMERLRGELLTELRQMSHQMERSRERLSRSRNERESNAAQREVEEMRKLMRDRELEADKIAGLIEQARTDMDATETERSTLDAALGASAGETESRLSEVEAALQTKGVARELLVGKVPPTVYRRYELIRKKRGSALAHTERGKCSACHMMVSPAAYQQLQRATELSQCASCNRLMYYRAAVAPEGTDGAGQTRAS